MSKPFDLVVIGGGVNGTGIARDAAMRGLSVMLVEKRDFGSGSSGANSGMIHGGLRYLLLDPEVTRLACIDSGYIQRIAPHLLFRIPFIYPFPWRNGGPERSLWRRVYDYLQEVYFAAYDEFQPFKNGKSHTRLSAEEALEIEPGLSSRIHGALTMDEYGIDPFRLCLLNARSAADHGAVLRKGDEIVGFLRGEKDAVVGVRLLSPGGEEEEVPARAVFNAAGPWAPRVAALAGVSVRLRPGKGVHLTLDRRLSNYAVLAEGRDGRQIFVMPHESASIIGTTDDDYYGDPDDIPITHDEVAYLLDGIERVFPGVREARLLRAWAGVRNTAWEWGRNEDDLSRHHAVIDHARDGVEGLFTLVGGKLASFRAQSEDAVDLLCRRLGRTARCRTHEVPLPGGDAASDPVALADEYGVSSYSAARLVHRHGSEAARVLDLCRQEPSLAEPVCACEGVLGAELVFAVRHEWATHLVDLRRRCRLAMGPCQGARCIASAAALLARERGLATDETHGEMVSLLAERWKGACAVASGEGLAQAELVQGAFFTTGRLVSASGQEANRR